MNFIVRHGCSELLNKVALENSKGLLLDAERAQFFQNLRASPFGFTKDQSNDTYYFQFSHIHLAGQCL